jgi:hypothetical protein
MNKNHSYKHNEQISNQNIDNSECFGVKFVKIYPEMTFLKKYGFGIHRNLTGGKTHVSHPVIFISRYGYLMVISVLYEYRQF